VRALCVLVAATLVAGCGADVPTVKVPTFPAGFGGPGPGGDTATFVVDGQTISEQESGSVSVSIPQAPQLTYSGPLGCRGRYFTGHLTEHIDILFRYSGRGAWMFIGTGDLYRFPAPRRTQGQLVWSRAFPDRGRITVLVKCARR
jgi:hypothetical protein